MQVHAFRSEPLGNGAPDALRRTGDQRSTSSQPKIHAILQLPRRNGLADRRAPSEHGAMLHVPPMANARTLDAPLVPPAGAAPVEWRLSEAPVAYPAALAEMDARVAAIIAGDASELVWLLEHPPLFTSGTGARAEDLAGTGRFPLFQTGRGGRLTYHGPGQRVAYAMLDLRRRGEDLRRYVAALEEWIIRSLADFGIAGERRGDRVGVWVRRPDKGEGCEDKIAAIGVRVKKWVTLHGISLNVAPDLSHYQGILACGVHERTFGVTSLADLGIPATMKTVDDALRKNFDAVFSR
jgi:lipoyl(octanoyl) transferase